MSFKYALIIAMGLSASACESSSESGDSDADYPQRVGGSGDATAATRIGTLASGQTLILDLSRAQRPDEAQMWACWTMPPADFAVGRAVCTNSPGLTLEITAANVDLACGLNPEFEGINVTSPLSFDSCSSYDVFAYEFAPKLPLSISP